MNAIGPSPAGPRPRADWGETPRPGTGGVGTRDLSRPILRNGMIAIAAAAVVLAATRDGETFIGFAVLVLIGGTDRAVMDVGRRVRAGRPFSRGTLAGIAYDAFVRVVLVVGLAAVVIHVFATAFVREDHGLRLVLLVGAARGVLDWSDRRAGGARGVGQPGRDRAIARSQSATATAPGSGWPIARSPR